MIVVSNSTAQTLGVGDTLTFDVVELKTGCGECFKKRTGIVKLCAAGGVYEITLNANLAGAADTQFELSIYGGSVPLEIGVVNSISSVTNAFNNASKTFALKNCCGMFSQITVRNTGTTNVIIDAGATLYIRRIA